MGVLPLTLLMGVLLMVVLLMVVLLMGVLYRARFGPMNHLSVKIAVTDLIIRGRLRVGMHRPFIQQSPYFSALSVAFLALPTIDFALKPFSTVAPELSFITTKVMKAMEGVMSGMVFPRQKVQSCVVQRCVVQRCVVQRCVVQRCVVQRCVVQRCVVQRCVVQRCVLSMLLLCSKQFNPNGRWSRWWKGRSFQMTSLLKA